MKEIKVRNVNQALGEAFWHLKTAGIHEQSRNGPVVVSPGPVITTYTNPLERVLFCPKRDANHVFHLMEALWMFAGEDNVEWLLQFNSKFDKYAEPDGKMHGAYGHRWRKHFGIDQVKGVIAKLQADPNTRQAVIAMWSPDDDLAGDWKDRPCNTHIYFDIRHGELNMMVCCRSNDAVWGAYGSNVVHFSMLQELIASAVGVFVGTYRQMSYNFHAYTDLPLVQECLQSPPCPEDYDPYAANKWYGEVFPMLHEGETVDQFLEDCKSLVSGGHGFYTRFVHEVAFPLMRAYESRKQGLPMDRWLTSAYDCDWKEAFQQWTVRREK